MFEIIRQGQLAYFTSTIMNIMIFFMSKSNQNIFRSIEKKWITYVEGTITHFLYYFSFSLEYNREKRSWEIYILKKKYSIDFQRNWNIRIIWWFLFNVIKKKHFIYSVFTRVHVHADIGQLLYFFCNTFMKTTL